MNIAILCGRLTREPETSVTANGNNLTRYSIAVDRRGKDQQADFFNISAFGKAGEFAANYFHQGMRVLIQGHIQTSSYTNRDGVKVNSFNIVADNQEFADGKRDGTAPKKSAYNPDDDFMEVPDGDDYGIPF